MSTFIDSHGYVMVYKPNHHRAKGNGYVAEHILKAEEMLGRELRELEEVHHEDEDRTNNSFDNLYVFATKEDHVRYHHNGVMVKENDYYISPDINSKEGTCSVCGARFTYKSYEQLGIYCSKECTHVGQRNTDRPTKEELLELIKSKSMVQIGKDYGVSDNSVRKWCKSYGLPHRKKDIDLLK